MEKDKRKVCGTCRYFHKFGGNWYCYNLGSDNCFDKTEYLDKCPQYVSRHKHSRQEDENEP